MNVFKKVLLFLMSANFANTFIQHGWEKFDAEGFWSTAFIERWGYGLYFMYFIGVLEFLGGIAILIPKVNKYGAFVLATVMLGAASTRIIFGTSLDDVIWILFSMVTLLYISFAYGMDKELTYYYKKVSNTNN
ncbi:DoxX family protein [Ekhidna sp. To15]|uniref:DoxX family protein n=1 Tax=Ekhidna sp. To15 TaxID=3395267 RepID=UPI003F528AEC